MIGQWHKSLEICQTAFDLAIEHSLSTRIIQGRGNFGNTYLSMGEWEKVITECEPALNMSPCGIWIPFIVTPLGDAYCKTGQLDKGITLLERWKTFNGITRR